MADKSWSDLSPRARRLIIAGAVIEGVLKIAALLDLTRRPAADVKGPKPLWAVALVVVNSAGALPIYYLRRGHR